MYHSSSVGRNAQGDHRGRGRGPGEGDGQLGADIVQGLHYVAQRLAARRFFTCGRIFFSRSAHLGILAGGGEDRHAGPVVVHEAPPCGRQPVDEGAVEPVEPDAPVYNEEAILRAAVVDLVDRLSASPWSYELMLAENGSTDRTVEVAAELERLARA